MDRDCTNELAGQARDATARRDAAADRGRRHQGIPRPAGRGRGARGRVPSRRAAGTTPPNSSSPRAPARRSPRSRPALRHTASAWRSSRRTSALGATLGGTVACGLAGPARAWSGPLRDYVLGVRLLTGDGRVLRFGGEVMKNVAGYDVSRLLAGSFGVLGVLLDVSLKVLPRPPRRAHARARTRRGRGARSPRGPLARCAAAVRRQLDGRTAVPALRRLRGDPRRRDPTRRRRGRGRVAADSGRACASRRIRSSRAARRCGAAPCRRTRPAAAARQRDRSSSGTVCSAGTAAPPTRRCSPQPPRPAVTRRCSVTRRPVREVFAPLDAPLLRLHRQLKQVFDPAGILNPGRMYAEL